MDCLHTSKEHQHIFKTIIKIHFVRIQKQSPTYKKIMNFTRFVAFSIATYETYVCKVHIAEQQQKKKFPLLLNAALRNYNIKS